MILILGRCKKTSKNLKFSFLGSTVFTQYVFAHIDPVGESVDTENVKEKLIKTVEDAKATYQNYEDKCTAKEVLIDAFFIVFT